MCVCVWIVYAVCCDSVFTQLTFSAFLISNMLIPAWISNFIQYKFNHSQNSIAAPLKFGNG